MVKELNWTGGAELEMVRDLGGQLWLIEMNPRFPAWVHGATIAGHNLPALLIQAATGVTAQPAVTHSDEFTRIVIEVPVRREYPLRLFKSPLRVPWAIR
jgi:predicted ATP-grasp superfamily ATP-dependent carboligase